VVVVVVVVFVDIDMPTLVAFELITAIGIDFTGE
jgi:hypothetical protein